MYSPWPSAVLPRRNVDAGRAGRGVHVKHVLDVWSTRVDQLAHGADRAGLQLLEYAVIVLREQIEGRGLPARSRTSRHAARTSPKIRQYAGRGGWTFSRSSVLGRGC
jgi:hypothetical protein